MVRQKIDGQWQSSRPTKRRRVIVVDDDDDENDPIMYTEEMKVENEVKEYHIDQTFAKYEKYGIRRPLSWVCPPRGFGYSPSATFLGYPRDDGVLLGECGLNTLDASTYAHARATGEDREWCLRNPEIVQELRRIGWKLDHDELYDVSFRYIQALRFYRSYGCLSRELTYFMRTGYPFDEAELSTATTMVLDEVTSRMTSITGEILLPPYKESRCYEGIEDVLVDYQRCATLSWSQYELVKRYLKKKIQSVEQRLMLSSALLCLHECLNADVAKVVLSHFDILVSNSK